jgi:hypothetical protein
VTNSAPYLGKKRRSSSGNTPSRSNSGIEHGKSDSPMWKRGNCSRSHNTTCLPLRASSVATLAPAGPPPITITSKRSAAIRSVR